MRALLIAILVVVGTGGAWCEEGATTKPIPAALKHAHDLFDKQNWKEARAAYEGFLKGTVPEEQAWSAMLRVMQCHLRMEEYDDAVTAGETMVKRFEGGLYEARAERVLGNLYVTLPHWGTEKGGKFHRNKWNQGIRKYTYRADRKQAVEHLERARSLYVAASSPPSPQRPPTEPALWRERLDCQFDLVAAVTRFGPYDASWQNWWYAWDASEDEFDDDTVDEFHGMKYGRYSGREQGRPQGLPVDEDGAPVFDSVPEQYSPELPPGQKMKYLLHEIPKLDQSETQEYTALALYRRAMLARARYGPDRLQRYASWWDGQRRPYQDQLEQKKVYDLADNEALTLVGTKLDVVKLPAEEDILGLLRQVVTRFREAPIAHEAQYAIGLHYQSRQQYNKALKEYAAYRQLFPKGGRLERIAHHEDRIRRPEVSLDQTTMQLAGDKAEVDLTHRNATEVSFAAYTLDLPQFLADCKQALRNDQDTFNYWDLRNLSYLLLQRLPEGGKEPYYKKYLGAKVAEWTAAVEDDGTHRPVHTKVTTPLRDRGCRLVEVTVKGGNTSRNLVVLQDLALVEKRFKGQTLYYVCDARNGSPVSNVTLDHFSFWYDYEKRKGDKRYRAHYTVKQASGKTDDAGIGLFTPEYRKNHGHPQVITLAKTDDGRMAFSGIDHLGYYYRASGQWSGDRSFVFTDRPVYRPGQTVKMKVWARRYRNGVYLPPKEGPRSLSVEIRDPKNNAVQKKQVSLDEFGGGLLELKLEDEPPLGMWNVIVYGTQAAGNQFRVEEYKKPEFEVTVEPGTDVARLGDKVEGVIHAKYLFGAPVTNAKVEYRIYRENYTHRYNAPGEWDWLYGPGYGYAWYPYDWFPWWDRWCCFCDVWYPWWGPRPKPARELVKEGETQIGQDGTVKFDFDTAAALKNHPDSDHLYTIEADVRDASRRVISGSGKVKVTRDEFYAFVEVDRGYYTPGKQIFAKVRTLTANNTPVSAKGRVVVSRVSYGGYNNAKLLEQPDDSWAASTDADGNLTFSVRAEKSGQYKLAFETKDSKGNDVKGAVVVWVAGADFDGRLYKFADLEILTDQRTYKPGDTAHVMLNCAREGATVLFSHRPDKGTLTNYQLIHLPQRSKVIDLKIEEGDVPNFFVEGTVVFDGQVHQEAREILVPPTEGVINVALSADKAEYKPGEKGTIKVKATLPDGKPARTQVALTAFDRAVLYIQPELTPDIRKHYWGQKRTHNLQMVANVQRTFAGTGGLYEPCNDARWWGGYLAQDWNGSWGPHWVNWAHAEAKDFDGYLGDGYAMNGLPGGGPGGQVGDTLTVTSIQSAVAAPAVPAAPAVSREATSGAVSSVMPGRKRKAELAAKPGRPAAPAYVEAEVRTEFADTALWLGDLVTGEDGTAETQITFPENLTTWRVRGIGMTTDTRVGEGAASATTTKNLLVRLQAPRFFMERDRVILSANVHNYLKTAKQAKVTLTVDDNLELRTKDTQLVDVPANGETRVDWEVVVRKEGLANVKMAALTDEESDAMEMAFPVLVHGIDKTVSTCGSLHPGDSGVAEVALDIPAERNPSASKLEVRFSPSLAGAIIDALPYLLDYPYGCTEQTMSRFLPAVLTQKMLQDMGLDLEDLKERRTNLNAQELGDAKTRAARYRYYHDSPVFDSKKLRKIVDQGLDMLQDYQRPDGGWGWWRNDRPSSYLTAYVVWGLQLAQDNDVALPAGVLDRGFQALKNSVREDVKFWVKPDRGVANTQAFIAYVLSLKKEQNETLTKLLLERRVSLTLYGKALLSLALRNLGDTKNADLVLRNLRQYEKHDDENETCYYETDTNHWWYWWNNDIEANAWILKAIIAADPQDKAAPRLIKWLLNNRHHGYYWRSTRDTAICATAFLDYMRAVGEDRPNYTLKVKYDGEVMKEVKITPDNFLAFDNRFTLAGDALQSGRHTLRLEREGDGALYYNTYLSYFTKEEGLKKAGLEIKVERQYYKLVRADRTATVAGSRLQDVQEKRVRYKRVPLADGDKLSSGDLVEVELKLLSKNDYDYLVFEDMKPAGCEPIEVRSGGHYGELCSNMELRDEKVAFFVTFLTQGEHLIQYRLRAETPGTFHALPTTGWAMYAPELRANSDEFVMGIEEA